MQFNIKEKALRYAKAAFGAAAASDSLTEFSQNMAIVQEVILHNAQLKFFTSPLIDYKTKLDYIQDLPFSEFSKNFLLFILTEKKFAIMPVILTELSSLIMTHNKEVKVEVTAATDLSAEALKPLRQMLEESLHKKLKLEVQVDKRILGGLILKINNKLLDASLQGKINNLQEYVKTAL